MRILTIASDLQNDFLQRVLLPSCAAVGLTVTVVRSTKEPFLPADKRHVLTDYLSQLDDLDELLLFTDAYDTLFLRGAEQIERAYASFREPIVFSGDLNSWPLGAIGFALYGDPPVGRYPYLNSGGFIGVAGDILDLSKRYPDPPSDRFPVLTSLRAHGYDTDARYYFSDQYYWTLLHLLERDSIAIDHDARIFEYLGPPIPDVVQQEMAREFQEFRERGRRSPLYQAERERLRERLREPSGAAQVHLASTITKVAALDLLDQGLLPAWLTGVLGGPPAVPTVETHHAGRILDQRSREAD